MATTELRTSAPELPPFSFSATPESLTLSDLLLVEDGPSHEGVAGAVDGGAAAGVGGTARVETGVSDLLLVEDGPPDEGVAGAVDGGAAAGVGRTARLVTGVLALDVLLGEAAIDFDPLGCRTWRSDALAEAAIDFDPLGCRTRRSVA